MSDCCENAWSKGILLAAGIVFTIVGTVFDWINYFEIRKNVDLENDASEKHEIDECKIQLQVCSKIILAFVILKLIASVVEIPVNISVFVREICYSEADSTVNVILLIIKLVVVLFEWVVLITLLITANYCLREQGVNVFPDITPDLRNDFLGGLFGTFGIVINRIGIGCAMKVINVFRACRESREEGDCCHGCLAFVFAISVIGLIVLICFLIYAYVKS